MKKKEKEDYIKQKLVKSIININLINSLIIKLPLPLVHKFLSQLILKI